MHVQVRAEYDGTEEERLEQRRQLEAAADERERRERERRARLAQPEPELPVICAWCPDFDPADKRNAGATHGICPSCAAKF